jgi:hypothetical protein
MLERHIGLECILYSLFCGFDAFVVCCLELQVLWVMVWSCRFDAPEGNFNLVRININGPQIL